MRLLFKIADQVRDFGRHHGARAELAQAVRVRMGRVMLHPVKRREQLFERLRKQDLLEPRIDARPRDIRTLKSRSINIVPEVLWCDCDGEYRTQ